LHEEAAVDKVKFIYNDYHLKSTNPGVCNYFSVV